MKFRLLILFLGIALSASPIKGQNLESFNEFGTAGWGVREKSTGRVIIEPKFPQILDCTDDYIVIRVTSGYAIIDTSENIIVPFSPYYTTIFPLEDSLYQDYFIESSMLGPDRNLPIMTYVIDSSRTCIAKEYAPCPAWKKRRDPNIPEYLMYIQKANDFHYYGELDSAFRYVRKAIHLQPQNPYTYFSRAKLSVLNQKRELKKLSEFQDVTEADSIINYLSAAESMETNPEMGITYSNYKYHIYKNLIKDKEQLKAVQKELKGVNAHEGRNGWYLLVSPGYTNGFEIELGLIRAALAKQPKFKLKDSFGTGFVFIGASYLKNFSSGLDGYKMYLFSFIQPISIGLHPIFYTNYSNTEFVLKPEIGFGYHLWNASIGYNFHVAGNKFYAINNLSFTLKMFIPLSKQKIYYTDSE